YPEDAEQDLKRYEKSFKKLPPAHKFIVIELRILLKKVVANAFEPPLDMSQDIEICENLDDVPENLTSSGGRDPICCSASISGRGCYTESGEVRCREVGNVIRRSPKADKKLEHSPESNSGDCTFGSECGKKADKADDNHVEGQEALYSVSGCNGNVSSSPPDWLDSSFQLRVPLVDVDKVRCIIRNIVRDWATEGQRERDQCYKPILEELERLFPDRCQESPPACLVPGAGLGRLALEISCLGFISQGNEFSYYMMICSSFILNHTQAAVEWNIHPWIHSNCNSLSDSDQLRAVSVPDIHPAR
ncbi:hypothetical protein RJ640_005150, partial [Escallonia rubra]